MDEEDIKELFDRVAKQFGGADEGTRGMFEMLVSTALRYREMFKEFIDKRVLFSYCSLSRGGYDPSVREQEI
ncbi:MAG: hypothetical protein WC956_08615 [bacterium]